MFHSFNLLFLSLLLPSGWSFILNLLSFMYSYLKFNIVKYLCLSVIIKHFWKYRVANNLKTEMVLQNYTNHDTSFLIIYWQIKFYSFLLDWFFYSYYAESFVEIFSKILQIRKCLICLVFQVLWANFTEISFAKN